MQYHKMDVGFMVIIYILDIRPEDGFYEPINVALIISNDS